MNLDKHLNVRYQSISIKRRHNNFEKSVERLEGEFMTDFVEIISRKRVINDEVPGKLTIEKLSMSKIYFSSLQFLYFGQFQARVQNHEGIVHERKNFFQKCTIFVALFLCHEFHNFIYFSLEYI